MAGGRGTGLPVQGRISPCRRTFSQTGKMKPWPGARVSPGRGEARGAPAQRKPSPLERSPRPRAWEGSLLKGFAQSSAPPLAPPRPILMQMRPFQRPGPFELVWRQQVAGAGKKPPEWAGAGQGAGRGRGGAGPPGGGWAGGGEITGPGSCSREGLRGRPLQARLEPRAPRDRLPPTLSCSALTGPAV